MLQARYAILLDGGFVTKLLGGQLQRAVTADDIVALCSSLQSLQQVTRYDLLRIYYYDAWPSERTVKRPISGQDYRLSLTSRFRQSQSLYDQLVMKPSFALRMGETRTHPDIWQLKARALREIKKVPRQLEDKDFQLDISQKGVDLRIGLDMARLALREMVQAIVVVTGDADFVPAFKFVRREGVKVVLATLGHRGVRRELKEHADFVVS